MSFEASNPSTSNEGGMSEYEKSVRENIRELHLMVCNIYVLYLKMFILASL